MIEFVLRQCGKLVKYVYCFSYYLIFGLRYRKYSLTVYVSPLAQMRNKRNLSLGPDCIIRQGASVGGRRVVFGKNVRLGRGAHVMGDVSIGDDVMLAPNVVIAGGAHGIERSEVPMVYQAGKSKGPISIGSDVWIGANSVILDGVKIGNGVVIGAGSVVTKDIDDFAIITGNPAKVLRYR